MNIYQQKEHLNECKHWQGCHSCRLQGIYFFTQIYLCYGGDIIWHGMGSSSKIYPGDPKSYWNRRKLLEVFINMSEPFQKCIFWWNIFFLPWSRRFLRNVLRRGHKMERNSNFRKTFNNFQIVYMNNGKNMLEPMVRYLRNILCKKVKLHTILVKVE